MASCTASSCPYATPVPSKSALGAIDSGAGSQFNGTLSQADASLSPHRLLNRAPFSPAGGGWISGISALSLPAFQKSMFDLFANLSSPETSWSYILNRTIGGRCTTTVMYRCTSDCSTKACQSLP